MMCGLNYTSFHSDEKDAAASFSSECKVVSALDERLPAERARSAMNQQFHKIISK